jgi:Oxidoreductase family, NAD-binding Rossmann fold
VETFEGPCAEADFLSSPLRSGKPFSTISSDNRSDGGPQESEQLDGLECVRARCDACATPRSPLGRQYLLAGMTIRAAIIGLGKMGLSHQSIANTHPELRLVAVCDTSSYVLDLLSKYTGIKAYSDSENMLR